MQNKRTFQTSKSRLVFSHKTKLHNNLVSCVLMLASSKLLRRCAKALSFLAFTLIVHGCYYDVIIEKEIEETQAISFSEDIIPIFKSSCISCHDGVVSYPSLLQNEAYQALWADNYIEEGDASSSKLVLKLKDNHPFEGAITDSELTKIQLWIQQGAEDN